MGIGPDGLRRAACAIVLRIWVSGTSAKRHSCGDPGSGWHGRACRRRRRLPGAGARAAAPSRSRATTRPSGPEPGDRRQIDPPLGGDAAREGRRLHPAAVRCPRRSRGGRLARLLAGALGHRRRGRCGRHCGRPVPVRRGLRLPAPRSQRPSAPASATAAPASATCSPGSPMTATSSADRDRRARRHDLLEQGAARASHQLHHRLVGLHLGEHVAARRPRRPPASSTRRGAPPPSWGRAPPSRPWSPWLDFHGT